LGATFRKIDVEIVHRSFETKRGQMSSIRQHAAPDRGCSSATPFGLSEAQTVTGDRERGKDEPWQLLNRTLGLIAISIRPPSPVSIVERVPVTSPGASLRTFGFWRLGNPCSILPNLAFRIN
jgi:hypothetical protein